MTIRAELGLPGQESLLGGLLDAGAAPTGIDGLISGPRFKRYLDRYQGDRKLALRLYTWNLAVSSAFWGPINVLEVAVRNAIHHRLAQRTGRGDWWSDRYIHLCRPEREAIDSTIDTLTHRRGPNPASDDVVAATSFGLWAGLMGAGKPRDRLFSYETGLWQPSLQHAFPYRGASGRKYIHRQLDDIRVLRNRIAHHEPIYNSPLDALYESILEVAGMMHPDARTFIETHSRAREVAQHRRTALETGQIRF